MKNAAQTRILAIVLALATVAACVLAAFNFEHENGVDVPTDGVWWVEAGGGLRAERVIAVVPSVSSKVEASGGLRAERVPVESPGHRAGIRTGDILLSVND